MSKLSDKQIKALSDKLGVEAFDIKAATLVSVLNDKYGTKTNGNPFKFGDVQQYYLRNKLPAEYSGMKVEMIESPIGKFLRVSGPEKQEQK